MNDSNQNHEMRTLFATGTYGLWHDDITRRTSD
jgi:hypothetical protein